VRILGECGSGEEALEMLCESEVPDLINIGVSRPGMSRIETTWKIKEFMASARVLILSMYDNLTFVHQAIEPGAAGPGNIWVNLISGSTVRRCPKIFS